MSEADELLDIDEAAKFLHVSETSLRRWTNAGRLACLRVGRRRERRFRRADLLAFMEHQPATGQTGAPRSSSSQPAHTVIDGIAYHLGAHLCGLFATELGRIKQVISFLGDGLRPGTVCFYSAPEQAQADALDQLQKSRPSLRADVASGRLVLGKYLPTLDGQLEYWDKSMHAAMLAGAQQFRIIGDLRGLASVDSEKDLFEYEAGYDEVIARRFPLITLCQYDVREFSGVSLLNTLKLHRDAFRYPADRMLG